MKKCLQRRLCDQDFTINVDTKKCKKSGKLLGHANWCGRGGNKIGLCMSHQSHSNPLNHSEIGDTIIHEASHLCCTAEPRAYRIGGCYKKWEKEPKG